MGEYHPYLTSPHPNCTSTTTVAKIVIALELEANGERYCLSQSLKHIAAQVENEYLAVTCVPLRFHIAKLKNHCINLKLDAEKFGNHMRHLILLSRQTRLERSQALELLLFEASVRAFPRFLFL